LDREEGILQPALGDVAVAGDLVVPEARPARAQEPRIHVREQQRIAVQTGAIEKPNLLSVAEHIVLDDPERRPAAAAAEREGRPRLRRPRVLRLDDEIDLAPGSGRREDLHLSDV